VTAITAGATVALRRAAFGSFSRGGFVVTKIEIVSAEVPHAGFGFDVSDPAFEPIGGTGSGFFAAAGREGNFIDGVVGIGRGMCSRCAARTAVEPRPASRSERRFW